MKKKPPTKAVSARSYAAVPARSPKPFGALTRPLPSRALFFPPIPSPQPHPVPPQFPPKSHSSPNPSANSQVSPDADAPQRHAEPSPGDHPLPDRRHHPARRQAPSDPSPCSPVARFGSVHRPEHVPARRRWTRKFPCPPSHADLHNRLFILICISFRCTPTARPRRSASQRCSRRRQNPPGSVSTATSLRRRSPSGIREASL